MEKIEKIRSLLLYILFLSLPFSIAGGDFAIIGLYLVTGYLVFKKVDHLENLPIFFWGMIVLILAAVLSSIFSDVPLESFKSFRKFWRFGLPIVLLMAFSKYRFEKFLRVTLIISILISIYSIIQFFTGLDILRSDYLQERYHSYMGVVWQAVGAFSHHLTLGGVFLLIFSLFGGLVFSREIKPPLKYLYIIGAFLSLITAFLTLGRSIWLGLVIVIVVFLSVLIPPKFKKVLAIVIVLVVGASWVAIKRIDNTSIGNTSIGHRVTSAISLKANKDRLMMWEAGVAVIKDHPVLGLGPNMAHQIEPYYSDIAKRENRHFKQKPKVGFHNIYLQTWVDFGILGLIGFLVMYLSIIKGIEPKINYLNVRTSNENAVLLGIMAGLCGNLVSGFFENNFRDGEVQIVIFVVMGLALNILQKKSIDQMEKPPI